MEKQIYAEQCEETKEMKDVKMTARERERERERERKRERKHVKRVEHFHIEASRLAKAEAEEPKRDESSSIPSA